MLYGFLCDEYGRITVLLRHNETFSENQIRKMLEKRDYCSAPYETGESFLKREFGFKELDDREITLIDIEL